MSKIRCATCLVAWPKHAKDCSASTAIFYSKNTEGKAEKAPQFFRGTHPDRPR